MPHAVAGNRKIYYEAYGHGVPLLLISGLGGGSWSWPEQINYFQLYYLTIVFDNRGSGRSSMPSGPYRMVDLAHDALLVLERLSADKAFVMGISMGGMIAQELALLVPDRIKALVLINTHCGGKMRIRPDPRISSAFLCNEGLSRKGALDKNISFLFSKRCLTLNREVVGIYRRHQLQAPIQPHWAFNAQVEAIRGFDCSRRLGNVKAPTLIVAGSEDRLIPFKNSYILAELIPDAEVVIVQGAGHALNVERPDLLNRIAHDFFKKVSMNPSTCLPSKSSLPQ